MELMEKLHPDNLGELPDEVRDGILAIWRSERDRVVRELEAMLDPLRLRPLILGTQCELCRAYV